MGSIQHDDIPIQKHYSNDSGDSMAARLNSNSVESSEVAGLASDLASSPTGMRDEIILLSWLIVLLRTRDGVEIRYDWAYMHPEEETVARSLAMNEVVVGLQSSIKETAAAVSRHIAIDAPDQSAPACLLLSTSSLSQTSEEAKDEVSGFMDVEYQMLS
jgi:hypothetical protein